MRTDYYYFQLGDRECVSLSDGSYDYQVESMVKNAPLSEVVAALQAHNMTTEVFTSPYSYLYVDAGKNKILVDTGAGKIAPTTGRLLESIYAAGITPEEIDTIFITHAHPDHVGGVLNDAGEPAFRNAKYFMNKVEWDFWISEEALVQAGKWFTDYARDKLFPLKEKMVLLEREGEILPGVSVLFAPGHTPGHMVVSFESNKERLLYTADTVLHPILLEHPEWQHFIDILPEQAMASKYRIYDLAALTESLVLVQHFPPFPSLGKVVKKEIGWEWRPIERTLK